MKARRKPNGARSRVRPAPSPVPADELVYVDSNGRPIRLLDDARTTPSERSELAVIAGKSSLSASDRGRIEAIANALRARASGSTRGSLLDSMPRPLRPPPTRVQE